MFGDLSSKTNPDRDQALMAIILAGAPFVAMALCEVVGWFLLSQPWNAEGQSFGDFFVRRSLGIGSLFSGGLVDQFAVVRISSAVALVAVISTGYLIGRVLELQRLIVWHWGAFAALIVVPGLVSDLLRLGLFRFEAYFFVIEQVETAIVLGLYYWALRLGAARGRRQRALRPEPELAHRRSLISVLLGGLGLSVSMGMSSVADSANLASVRVVEDNLTSSWNLDSGTIVEVMATPPVFLGSTDIALLLLHTLAIIVAGYMLAALFRRRISAPIMGASFLVCLSLSWLMYSLSSGASRTGGLSMFAVVLVMVALFFVATAKGARQLHSIREQMAAVLKRRHRKGAT